MVIDLIDKLIDRCIQLVRHKEAVHRRLFEDYVEPIQSDFEAIHQDYLETFQKYRAMVKTSDPLNKRHPVIDALKEDALFNATVRSRIRGFTVGVNDPRLKGFVRSIRQYFYDAGLPDDNLPLWHNAPRMTARENLLEIVSSSASPKSKKEKAIELFDEIVETLQRNYAHERQEFSQLKRSLLRLK